MNNCEIRQAAKAQGVRFWQIAAYLGVSESTITRLLRLPLPAEQEKLVMQVIDELAGKRSRDRDGQHEE